VILDVDTVPILPPEHYIERKRVKRYKLSLWSFWFGLSLVTTSTVLYIGLQFIK
jgi:hypothetical protein